MAKKKGKKEPEPDDDDEFYKLSKEKLIEILKKKELEQSDLKEILTIAASMPKELFFSVFLTFAWSQTHDGFINSGDLILGTLGGFTLEPALRGGEIANAWAIGYLSALGFNLWDEKFEQLKDHVEDKIRTVEDRLREQVEADPLLIKPDLPPWWPPWVGPPSPGT